MKIAVLAGSPKGRLSITMQYVEFLETTMYDCEFQYIQISQRINKIQTNRTCLNEIIETIKQSECVIWAFPVYFMSVPAQYKRFIELIFEHDLHGAFAGKYTGVMATSIHFFDHAAVEYMRAICDDLNMIFTGFLSLTSQDLLTEKGRLSVKAFGEDIVLAKREKPEMVKQFHSRKKSSFIYEPGESFQTVKMTAGTVLVLHDGGSSGDENLRKMVNRLEAVWESKINVLNINEINIKGGCQGCCRCAANNRCVYEGRDDFVEFIRSNIPSADIVVFACRVVDRGLSSAWHTFFNRCFFNNHVPLYSGKSIGLILSPVTHDLTTVRHSFHGFIEMQRGNLVGFVTDESRNSKDIDIAIQQLAKRLIVNSERKLPPQTTFLGLGGHKIIRDEIFDQLRAVFPKDDEYFTAHGLYDFPTSNWFRRLRNFMAIRLLKIPVLRRAFDNFLKRGMVMELQSVVELQKKRSLHEN